MVAVYYDLMNIELKKFGKDLPVNRDVNTDMHGDKVLRDLDCATIEFMHKQIRTQYIKDIVEKNHSTLKIFDSVRGVFPEGGPAYNGSGFWAKSHIQICIRNANCIKGFFQKREELDFILQETSRQ